MDSFNRRLLSDQAAGTWNDGSKVMGYYQTALSGQKDVKNQSPQVQLPDLQSLTDGKREEYRKWTPFADVWDVRTVPL